MPQVSLRGMDPETAVRLAPAIKETIVSFTGTDAKYVTTEYICSFQTDGSGICASFPKIDILWLTGRPQEMHDDLAKALTELFRTNGFEKLQVTFTNMPPNYFYDNGEHY